MGKKMRRAERNAEIQRLARAKTPVADIAVRFGMGLASVRSILAPHGFSDRNLAIKRAVVEDCKSYRRVAEEYELTPCRVRQITKRICRQQNPTMFAKGDPISIEQLRTNHKEKSFSVETF